MFAPVVVVHPLRVARLRLMTITLTGFWTAATIAAVVHGLPEAGVLPKAVLIAGALYYIVLPLFRRLSRHALGVSEAAFLGDRLAWQIGLLCREPGAQQ
jgi:hypothetical protein